MGSKEKKGGGGLSRRDFLKVSAAGTAIGAAGFDFALRPAIATAASAAMTYHTTCPYCSAQCGQLVAVDSLDPQTANILDIYGDKESPINTGGLCAKGAGSYQLVQNRRRLGVPENTAMSGTAWKRTGDGAWSEMTLTSALTEIATGLVGIRGPITPGSGASSNATAVQFFGCSHMNNEPNYLYRKLIANFGTSRTEHQARI